MPDSDDPLFDPHVGIGGRLEDDGELRQRILDEGWFPAKKRGDRGVSKGSRSRKGQRITWLVESDAKLVKVGPDQVIATPGNIFSAAKLATFARMMRQGEIPYALVPHGYLDKVSKTDVEETQEARAGDLLYDGMTRPFSKDEIGKTIVRLNAGNHRAFASFMAGEPYIWVALIDRGGARRSNPARKAAVDAADFIVTWARGGDIDYIANVIEAELERFDKNANAPIIERAFRGLDVVTQMSAKDLEDQSAINTVGGTRPAARASAIRIVRAYGKVMGVPQQPTNIGYIAQLIEMSLRGVLARTPRQASARSRAVGALDFINETRRRRHERPLDPDREGWTDDDIILEAKRLQQNPSSMTELTADEVKVLVDAVVAYEDIVDEDIDEYRTRPESHRAIYRSLVKKIDVANKRVAELTADEAMLLGAAVEAYEDIVDEDIDEYKTRPVAHRKAHRALTKRIVAMKARSANPPPRMTDAEYLAWLEARLDEARRLAAHRGIALHVGFAARRELFSRYGLPSVAPWNDLLWLGFADPLAASFAGQSPNVFYNDNGTAKAIWAADPQEALAKWRARAANPSTLATKARLLEWRH